MADALKPAQIVGSMIELGWAKTTMPVGQLLVRSGLAGALLGVATTLAFAATAQTGVPLVGALIFPVVQIQRDAATRAVQPPLIGVDRHVSVDRHLVDEEIEHVTACVYALDIEGASRRWGEEGAGP